MSLRLTSAVARLSRNREDRANWKGNFFSSDIHFFGFRVDFLSVIARDHLTLFFLLPSYFWCQHIAPLWHVLIDWCIFKLPVPLWKTHFFISKSCGSRRKSYAFTMCQRHHWLVKWSLWLYLVTFYFHFKSRNAKPLPHAAVQRVWPPAGSCWLCHTIFCWFYDYSPWYKCWHSAVD